MSQPNQPEIAILMPVYNMAGFLEDCVQSIQHQSFQNWELIAIDDFSTDNSYEALMQFAQRDRRIQVCRNDEKGIVPALAKAFNLSRGTFITRMDADDRMPQEKLMRLRSVIGDSTKRVVTGKVRYFSDEGVSEGYLRYEKWLNGLVENHLFEENSFRECVIASPNWMVHRSCFEKDISLAGLKYPEDYDLVFRWMEAGYQIAAVNEVTHFWREHPGRTSRNSEVYQQASFFRLKTDYFVKLKLVANEPVQLIGSGTKAKLVASHLRANQIPFTAFDFGEKWLKKGGRSIHDLNPDHQTILTNWPVSEKIQEEIVAFLKSKKLYFGHNVWLF